MIGGQHLGLELLTVAPRLRVLAAALSAGVAEVFLLAAGRFTIEPQAVTAAVVTQDCFRDHDPVYSILPMLDYYPRFEVP